MAQAQAVSESFASPRKFYDDENFPWGFDRSGEFTPAQAQTLTRHGIAMKQLAMGERAPVTPEEEHFVAFCRGEEPASNIFEKTWARYTEVINRDTRFITLCDTVTDADSDSYSYDDED